MMKDQSKQNQSPTGMCNQSDRAFPMQKWSSTRIAEDSEAYRKGCISATPLLALSCLRDDAKRSNRLDSRGHSDLNPTASAEDEFHARLKHHLRSMSIPGDRPGTLLSHECRAGVCGKKHRHALGDLSEQLPRRRIHNRVSIHDEKDYHSEDFHRRLASFQKIDSNPSSPERANRICSEEIQGKGLNFWKCEGPLTEKLTTNQEPRTVVMGAVGLFEATNASSTHPADEPTENLPEEDELQRTSGDVHDWSQTYVAILSNNFSGHHLKSTSLLDRHDVLRLPLPNNLQNDGSDSSEQEQSKHRDIEAALAKCQSNESSWFKFYKAKRTLNLKNMNLNANDIPSRLICGSPLGNSIAKIILSGNKLEILPSKLVQQLPVLTTLDLAECHLKFLPDKWDLPKLTRLDLSHNLLKDFPDERFFEGLPELRDLNLYANKIAYLKIPKHSRCVKNIISLNLGYNDISNLPREMNKFKHLKYLNVMNNFLEEIPPSLCQMSSLKSITIANNPTRRPPSDVCERGLGAMRRYWDCVYIAEAVAEDIDRSKKLDRRNKIMLKSRSRPQSERSASPTYAPTSRQCISEVSIDRYRNLKSKGC